MPVGELKDSGELLLSLLVFFPLIGALLLFFVPQEEVAFSRRVALFISGATFLFSLLLLGRFRSNEAFFQLLEVRSWLPQFGVRYLLGVDGISLWLVLLTALLTLLVIWASSAIQERVRAYLAALLLLESGMLGAFLALDAITFYLFWELMLIPMYLIIGIWGGPQRVYAAIKFVLFTALGSLLMLVAIIYLGLAHQAQFGELSFYLGDWQRLTLSAREEFWLCLAFVLAFIIKIPLFPLHTWLPDAHVEAPTGGSVILAGVLLKFGLYGLIRFCLPLFPLALPLFVPYLAALAVIGIIYGALLAWVQADMKKLVAYSSVSHMGFCVLGFCTLSTLGLSGAILQMLNHGISTGALFFLVGIIYARTHSRYIADYGGLAARVPVFSAVLLIFTLSSIAVPLTNGFVGEFTILSATFHYDKRLAAIALLGVILSAVYMLSFYRRVIFGPLSGAKSEEVSDLSAEDRICFAPLIALLFFIGLLPQVFFSRMEASVESAVHAAQKRQIAAQAQSQEIKDGV